MSKMNGGRVIGDRGAARPAPCGVGGSDGGPGAGTTGAADTPDFDRDYADSFIGLSPRESGRLIRDLAAERDRLAAAGMAQDGPGSTIGPDRPTAPAQVVHPVLAALEAVRRAAAEVVGAEVGSFAWYSAYHELSFALDRLDLVRAGLGRGREFAGAGAEVGG